MTFLCGEWMKPVMFSVVEPMDGSKGVCRVK